MTKQSIVSKTTYTMFSSLNNSPVKVQPINYAQSEINNKDKMQQL